MININNKLYNLEKISNIKYIINTNYIYLESKSFIIN